MKYFKCDKSLKPFFVPELILFVLSSGIFLPITSINLKVRQLFHSFNHSLSIVLLEIIEQKHYINIIFLIKCFFCFKSS